MSNGQTAEAIHAALSSPNESDSNLEPANVVDGLFSIARALQRLGNADASTPMGALEAHGKAIEDGAEKIACALDGVAEAIREMRA